MTHDNTYNGWTSYATWRVNLEFFDGSTLDDLGITVDDDVEACIEDHVKSIIEMQSHGLALDYALTFLHDVDWRQIAEHIIEASE